MSAAANSRSPMKRASRFPGWCWPPARARCGSICPAPISPGVHTFRDTRDVDLLLALAAAEEARRRGRRRIARARGGLWPGQGRRAGDADPSDGPADGAPARCAGGGTAEVAGRDARASRSCSMPTPRAFMATTRVEGVELTDGRMLEADAVIFAAGIRPNTVAGKGSRHSRQPRRRGRRSSADRRAGYLRARRMRRASRHLLRPGRAGL